MTHIKDLNFVLLSVTRDKLAEDTDTQTKVQLVESWMCNQPLQRAQVAATRKFDACSTKEFDLIRGSMIRAQPKILSSCYSRHVGPYNSRI
ncbi:hypothetical protein KIN20_031931 [Parelaphostrongylus tenuis]|uniref:Uncharacterized protein n=1 Tax=Parelaphostrongylus tenuis TaxID=148309 RepID=A0AAD5R5S3_PARTN|nr:hypothetical protein KIN20_031931 [Parelaphostrongylus tenuis]